MTLLNPMFPADPPGTLLCPDVGSGFAYGDPGRFSPTDAAAAPLRQPERPDCEGRVPEHIPATHNQHIVGADPGFDRATVPIDAAPVACGLKPTRRTVIMNAMVSAASLLTASTVSCEASRITPGPEASVAKAPPLVPTPASGRRSVPVLCQRAASIRTAIAAENALASKALDVVDQMLVVPPEIQTERLATDPDFVDLDERTRSMPGKHAMPPYAIETAIERAEAGTCKITLTEDGTTLISLPTSRAASPEDLARGRRLRERLTALNGYYRERDALFESTGYNAHHARAERLDNRLMAYEAAISDAVSANAADLLAKVRFYELDPDMFSDAPPDQLSIAESILRDLPIVLDDATASAAGHRPGQRGY